VTAGTPSRRPADPILNNGWEDGKRPASIRVDPGIEDGTRGVVRALPLVSKET